MLAKDMDILEIRGAILEVEVNKVMISLDFAVSELMMSEFS